MKLTFDYYHNLEKVELYLCNPDGKELFCLQARNRNVTLRANDLSEMSFEVDDTITLSSGETIKYEAYDYVQTKRRVFATNIGWFQITGVEETDNGSSKYKSVSLESYQSVLKNIGFLSEERVYCLYNKEDPLDNYYDASKEDSVPSVVGQLNKQLDIELAIGQGRDEPSEPYKTWTITYINEDLKYANKEGICRSFKSNTAYGYDWIVNEVEEAFGVIVFFDIYNLAIHILTPEEFTESSGVLFSFDNFMKRITTKENADNIVTVLNCNGDGCDIRAINPTGTNYICDFSYYMDSDKKRWMSDSLISALEDWKDAVDDAKDDYREAVGELRTEVGTLVEKKSSIKEASLRLTDLRNAQNKRNVIGSGTAGNLCGVVITEKVCVGRNSMMDTSDYHGSNGTTEEQAEETQGETTENTAEAIIEGAFYGSSEIVAYKDPPTFYKDANNGNGEFAWEQGETNYTTDTADNIIKGNLSGNNQGGTERWYFIDSTDGSSYCKLTSASRLKKDATSAIGYSVEHYCEGFERYTAITYPKPGADETILYTDTLQWWVSLWESLVMSLKNEIEAAEGRVKDKENALSAISDPLNIITYISNRDGGLQLLKELYFYWIEGDYTNENISVNEKTTEKDEIGLQEELLECGYVELEKVSKPQYSFNIESIDATKQYEFKSQMELLSLGKTVNVEKEDGAWYDASLLEMSFNLDDSTEFSLGFSNGIHAEDWGYTYADLMSKSSSTSRQVSANWQNMNAYAKDKAEIKSITQDPLDTSLRADTANAENKEFVVDSSGILLRKKVEAEGTVHPFEQEQLRITNNNIIFTDDGWETAKATYGKIGYETGENDENGVPVRETKYGVKAEAIVGDLIIGKAMKVRNNNNTIMLDDGITVMRGDEVVFEVKPNGEVNIKGGCNIDGGALKSGTINASRLSSVNSRLSELYVSCLELPSFYDDGVNSSYACMKANGIYRRGRMGNSTIDNLEMSWSYLFRIKNVLRTLANRVNLIKSKYNLFLNQEWYTHIDEYIINEADIVIAE